jgi:hypothetical protein
MAVSKRNTFSELKIEILTESSGKIYQDKVEEWWTILLKFKEAGSVHK